MALLITRLIDLNLDTSRRSLTYREKADREIRRQKERLPGIHLDTFSTDNSRGSR